MRAVLTERPIVERCSPLGAMEPLIPGEIHLWQADLDRLASDVNLLRSVLSAEELARAERFRFEQDRARYVTARGTLRRLLAGYCATPANRLRFVDSHYGKPA